MYPMFRWLVRITQSSCPQSPVYSKVKTLVDYDDEMLQELLENNEEGTFFE